MIADAVLRYPQDSIELPEKLYTFLQPFQTEYIKIIAKKKFNKENKLLSKRILYFCQFNVLLQTKGISP